jgi:hypothetical protein
MAKRRKSEQPKSHFRAENSPPVDPEDFAFALRLGVAAASYQMPMERPANFHFRLKTNDEDVQSFRLADIPMNRSGLAIREHCAEDSEKFKAIMMRQFALMRILRANRMKPWVREEGGERSIHPAVVEAAAVMPLDSDGAFQVQPFIERVSLIAQRMESEEGRD